MRSLIILCLLGLTVNACQQEPAPKDYAVIHGTITNPIDSLDLRLYDPQTSTTHMVEVDEQGNFRDTLKLEQPAVFTGVYEGIFTLYLQNDMDLQLTVDTRDFSNSLSYAGKGGEENDFLKYQSQRRNQMYEDDVKGFFSLDSTQFTAKTDAYLNDISRRMEERGDALDTAFISNRRAEIEQFKEQNAAQYAEQQEINRRLGKGMASPTFSDYTNYRGGTSALEDFRGSYVFIDVWATWCAPCKYEIPFLKQLEKDYEGKNIQFVSLSIDQPEDEQKWRDMIADKELSGVHVLADAAYDSQFIRDYYIYGIPRFILLDPQGNIIDYDAPRPSEEKLRTVFDSLDI